MKSLGDFINPDQTSDLIHPGAFKCGASAESLILCQLKKKPKKTPMKSRMNRLASRLRHSRSRLNVFLFFFLRHPLKPIFHPFAALPATFHEPRHRSPVSPLERILERIMSESNVQHAGFSCVMSHFTATLSHPKCSAASSSFLHPD